MRDFPEKDLVAYVFSAGPYKFSEEFLLKCPFCGETPQILELKTGWVVECRSMGCIVGRTRTHPALTALVSNWNTRDGKS